MQAVLQGTVALYFSADSFHNSGKVKGEMREVYTEVSSGEIKSEWLNGVYGELANLLGVDAALKIHKAYRGQQLTFPVHLFTKEFMAESIVREFDGHNVKKLASKFGYSEKWIRKIIKDNEYRKEE